MLFLSILLPGFGEYSSRFFVSSLISNDNRFFARVLDRTMFQGLPCLVYPLGAASLDRVLDACRLRPLPRAHIRAIVWQLSNAVAREFAFRSTLIFLSNFRQTCTLSV